MKSVIISREECEEIVLIPTKYYTLLPGNPDYQMHNIIVTIKQVLNEGKKVKIDWQYIPKEYIAKTPEGVKPEQVFEKGAELGIDDQVNFILGSTGQVFAGVLLMDVGGRKSRLELLYSPDCKVHRREVYEAIERERVQQQ